ncbi:MAG: PilZ domain-containing protein [Phycisphaerae bacterium]
MVNAQGGTDDSGGAEIQRMVESAHEGGHADQFTGQRAATRFAAGMQLDVSTDPGVASCTMPVTMHNVSDGGFAFWSKRQFRMNSELFVREFSSDNSLPWVPAVVTHCTTGIKGYLVGAQFS